MLRYLPILGLMLFSFVLSGQTVTFMDCNGRMGIDFTLDAVNSPDSVGRNVYVNAGMTQEIRYNDVLMRWELKVIGMGGMALFASDAPYFPDPPASSAEVWTDLTGACGTNIMMTGDGTQNQVCPAMNLPLSVTCQNVSFTLDSLTEIIDITADDILADTTATCGIMSIVLSQTSFAAADEGDNPVTVTVTDFSGATSTCIANVAIALPVEIPTLSQWGIIVLSLSLLIVGAVFLYQERRETSHTTL